MRQTLKILLLLMLATTWCAGCKKEPETPRASGSGAAADAGVDRAPASDAGARATGGVFNDPAGSQPTTRP
jgi:hypothetical protein